MELPDKRPRPPSHCGESIGAMYATKWTSTGRHSWAVKGDFEMFGRFHPRSLRCEYDLGRSLAHLHQWSESTSFVVSLVSKHRVISKIYDTLHTAL